MSKSMHNGFQSAQKLFREGKLTESAKLCRAIIDREPDHADANFLLGLIDLKLKKAESAEQYFTKAVTMQPHNALYLINLGNAYRELGKLADAEKTFLKAIAARPGFAEACYNLGIVLQKQKKNAEAISAYRQALQFRPDFGLAHFSLGILLQELGRIAEAEESYKQALESAPEMAMVYNNLGIVQYQQGKTAEAVESYRRALASEPGLAMVHNNLGITLYEQGYKEQAALCYKRAIAINPHMDEAFNNLSLVYSDLGELADAEKSCQQAIKINPGNASAYNNLGIICQKRGGYAEAKEAYEKALHLKPDLAEAYRHITFMVNQTGARHYYSATHAEALKIQQLLSRKDLSSSDRVHLCFAMGEIYDNCQQYEQAFQYYEAANELRCRERNFSRRQAEEEMEQLMAAYSSNLFEANRVKGSDSLEPVFIVGLPRSGKTRLERILAGHPQIFPAGEMTMLEKFILRRLPDLPDGKNTISQGGTKLDSRSARAIAEDYLGQLVKVAGPGHKRIINTFANNHKLLGIIALIFPGARILYCRRDPLDNCLAIYFKYFKPGFDYAYDLQDAGFYFRLYEKIMDHWQRALPLPIYTVRYEELVETPAEVLPGLVNYLGLDWDAHCETMLEGLLNREEPGSNEPPLRADHPRGIGWSANYRQYLGPLQDSLAAETA